MPNNTPNELLFKEEFIRHADMIDGGVTDQAVIDESVKTLEQSGLSMLASDNQTAREYTETMHSVFSKLTDLEVVPPYTDAQKTFIAGKVSVYASLMETFSEKKPAKNKKTDLSESKTDGAKR